MLLKKIDDYRAIVDLDSSEFIYLNKITGILRKLSYSEYVTKLKRYIISIKRLEDFEKEIEELCIDSLYIILDEKVTKTFFEYTIFAEAQKKLKDIKLLEVTLGEYNNYSILPLMPYQTIGAHFVYRAKRALLADVVGLGKTPQSIIAAEKMMKKDGFFNTLVVVPSSLKKKWYNDVEKFLGPDRAVMVDGTKPVRVFQYSFVNVKNKFIIMNYDLAIRDWDEHLFELLNDDKNKKRIVIYDECQYLKNDTAKRTGKCLELTKYCDSVIGLSATFLETSIMDVFNIMKVIDVNTLGSKYWNFFNKYVITDFWGKEIGHNDITDVVEALEPIKIRRQKEQVLKQLPDRSEITYWCKLTKEQESCYNDVLNNIITKIKSDKRMNQVATADILAQIQLLIQVCLSTELLDYNVVSSSKLTLLYDIMEQIGNQKVVIFVKYIKMVEIIARELNKRGYKTHFIHGKSIKNVTEKQDVVDRFNDTDKHQVLVTSDILKEGIDLVGASVLINFDMLWNPASMEQRAGRLDRIGQKNNVTVMYLVTEGTIEQKMFDSIQARKDLSTMVVDGGYKSSRITIKQLLYMAGVEG